MRLTERSTYALLTMLDIASNSKGNPVRAIDIAERQKLDQDYLYQVIRRLRLAKLVLSEKGKGGGYLLAKKAKEISVYDIFKAAELKIDYSKSLRDPNKRDTPEYVRLHTVMNTLCKCINEDLLKPLSLEELLSSQIDN